MNTKDLAKQFLQHRQVEKINRLAEEQIAEAREEEEHSLEAEVIEVDENTLSLDQLLV